MTILSGLNYRWWSKSIIIETYLPSGSPESCEKNPFYRTFNTPPNPSVSRQNGVSFIETPYFVLLYSVTDESHGHSPILFPVFTLKTGASCQQYSHFCALQSIPVQSEIHIFQPTSRIQLPLPTSPTPVPSTACIKNCRIIHSFSLSFTFLLYKGIMADYQWIWWNCHEIWWSDSKMKEINHGDNRSCNVSNVPITHPIYTGWSK